MAGCAGSWRAWPRVVPPERGVRGVRRGGRLAERLSSAHDRREVGDRGPRGVAHDPQVRPGVHRIGPLRQRFAQCRRARHAERGADVDLADARPATASESSASATPELAVQHERNVDGGGQPRDQVEVEHARSRSRIAWLLPTATASASTPVSRDERRRPRPDRCGRRARVRRPCRRSRRARLRPTGRGRGRRDDARGRRRVVGVVEARGVEHERRRRRARRRASMTPSRERLDPPGGRRAAPTGTDAASASSRQAASRSGREAAAERGWRSR